MATLILQSTYRLLEEKLKDLDKKMEEVGHRIAHARELGDLKENAEYHAAREEMSLTIYKKQKSSVSKHNPQEVVQAVVQILSDFIDATVQANKAKIVPFTLAKKFSKVNLSPKPISKS